LTPQVHSSDAIWGELWISLGSLLRSYTAAHGLNCNRHAMVEVEIDESKISICRGAKWLRFQRENAFVTWARDNGSSGEFELTVHGRVRGSNGEEELDLAAESWARELMHDHTTELAQ
jgi:hypothetical protein